jgi:hypothetical protein|tara:strand:+ start:1153 stop:3444 length:2292 start_codon:yes stop_codon:yes gene_type:complete
MSATETATPTTVAAPEDFDAKEERLWVESLARMPAAKPILQHFAAFEAIIKSGGQKGVEPPIDQVATWRRMFCWMYQRTDAPFGILSPFTAAIPKCICICNLSGNRAFYFSDNLSLGRILCLTPQENTPRIIAGIQQVFQKAKEIDASVIVLFCLPFQTGMERCYWEARTIRKTKKGAIKDGEMFFSVNDREARTVPCTLASEHWPDSMFDELCKTFMSVVSPVCLDHVEDSDPRTATMSLEQAIVMIGMLKSERKKLMDEHRRSTDALKAKALEDVKRLGNLAKDAESRADARVAKVADASKAAEDTIKKKMAAMDEHNSSLMKQVASQKTAVKMANSMVAGMTLEHEQETKEAAARQKALESQVSSLQSSHAKQVAEQTRARKDMVRSHQTALAEVKRSLEEYRKEAESTKTAAALVSKSADAAHRAQADADTQVRQALLDLAKTKTELEAIKKSNDSAIGACAATKQQMDDVASEADKLKASLKASESSNAQLKSAVKETDEARAATEEALRKADEAREEAEKALKVANETATAREDADGDADKIEDNDAALVVLTEKELKETKAELGRKDHLLKETEKRTKALESRIRDLEAEIKDAKRQKPPTDAAIANAPAQPQCATSVVPSGKGQGSQSKRRGGRADAAVAGDEHNGPMAQATVHVNQNTMYMQNGAMHPPQQQHGFPAQGNFVVDPMLEGMISQLHSALQTITAAARTASSSTRAAEMSQAKLDAIMAQSGMGGYYDAPQPMQPQFFPRGNGGGY